MSTQFILHILLISFLVKFDNDKVVLPPSGKNKQRDGLGFVETMSYRGKKRHGNVVISCTTMLCVSKLKVKPGL